MIYYFTPYAVDKNFFEAIDRHFSLVQPRDWVFILDSDTAFLRSDFGQRIQEYISRYPSTGLFTCYASRCHYRCQQGSPDQMDNDSILFHKNQADLFDLKYRGKVQVINRRIAGHLMGIKTTTWYRIREEVMRTSAGKKILGIDTKISNAIIASGMNIHLMKGIYILHYLRMKEGINSTEHLV